MFVFSQQAGSCVFLHLPPRPGSKDGTKAAANFPSADADDRTKKAGEKPKESKSSAASYYAEQQQQQQQQQQQPSSSTNDSNKKKAGAPGGTAEG